MHQKVINWMILLKRQEGPVKTCFRREEFVGLEFSWRKEVHSLPDWSSEDRSRGWANKAHNSTIKIMSRQSESEVSSNERPQKIRSLQEIYELNQILNMFCLFAGTESIDFEEAFKIDKWRKVMNEANGVIEKNETWNAIIKFKGAWWKLNLTELVKTNI